MDTAYSIRATISIVWKKEHNKLRIAFENNLRNNCEKYTKTKDKERILSNLGIDKPFFKDYDFVGKITNTSQPSYIIKENIGSTRTSFELFNDRQHIKEHVKFIKKELHKTIKEQRKLKWCLLFLYCRWESHFSINNINFEPKTLKKVMSDNLPILAGWIAPLAKLLYDTIANNNAEGTIRNLNSINLRIAGIEMLIIFVIYLIISLAMYKREENVIKL